MGDIYFWRQSLILFACLLNCISIGFMLAFPSVLSPAITSHNSTDIITTGNHASWIVSVNGFGGLFGSIALSPIMQTMGRKASKYSINALLVVGWIMFPFAKNIGTLYAARFIQGTSAVGIYINAIIISEYVHPSRRGYYTTLNKVSTALGALCCHTMGASWTWRQIATFAAIFNPLSIILTFFWPESPSYLALKGRFSECEKSFIWLNGNSDESYKHLKSLVGAQRDKAVKNKKRHNNLVEILKTFLKKDFQKALLVSTVLNLSLEVCGRNYLQVYVIQIMMELLDSKTLAIYSTIGSDIVAIIAFSLSTLVISYAKRRTILFYSGSFAVLLMLLTSVLVYLKTVYSFSNYLLWFIASVIILQSFIINIGMIPVAFTLFGEIFPLEHKGLGVCICGVMFASLFAFNMKLTPVLMEHTGLYGTYAIFGTSLAVCLVVLFLTVPETMDKTLQDIEDELNDVQRKEMLPMERETLMQPSEFLCKELRS